MVGLLMSVGPSVAGTVRCYFDLVDATQRLADREGVEVSDLDEAREVARATLAEMVEQGKVSGVDLRGWRLEAADESGAVLFTIRFDTLLN